MKKGFTLIELLVVIAIIALLTGIIMTNLTSARAKARDAKRISDLSQIQLALELYYDRCKAYPASDNGQMDTTVQTEPNCFAATSSGVTLGTYIAQLPVPPTSSEVYGYLVSSTGDDYVLHTHLEYTNDAVKDGISAANKPSYASSLTCDNSDSSLDYCVGPK